jgi:hypothetical protein
MAPNKVSTGELRAASCDARSDFDIDLDIESQFLSMQARLRALLALIDDGVDVNGLDQDLEAANRLLMDMMGAVERLQKSVYNAPARPDLRAA